MYHYCQYHQLQLLLHLHHDLFLKYQVDDSSKVTLAAYAYDNLGRLQSKSLHGSAVNKQSYTYNVCS